MKTTPMMAASALGDICDGVDLDIPESTAVGLCRHRGVLLSTFCCFGSTIAVVEMLELLANWQLWLQRYPFPSLASEDF